MCVWFEAATNFCYRDAFKKAEKKHLLSVLSSQFTAGHLTLLSTAFFSCGSLHSLRSVFRFGFKPVFVTINLLQSEFSCRNETMVEAAEQAIRDLRETLSSLDADYDGLSSLDSNDVSYQTKIRTLSELITQALLKADSVQISKDLAADALRNGEREKSCKVAVLLSRRKKIVKKLYELGDKVDELAKKTDPSVSDHSHTS